jgi:hypothetical protein|tara:strand:+ start:6519 stop:7214 length:696 start_codon:yes stop_codon:yes gene_type:complete
MNNKIWIASFDIGHRNLCFSIEEVDENYVNCLKKLPKSAQYNQDGTPTDKQKEILFNIYKNTRTIIFKNKDITNKVIKTLDTEVFHLFTDHLDEYLDYWDKCSYFIIEKQMSFGKMLNIKALKLGQHCFSYFSFKYSRFKEIVEFPAYHKTQILGAEKIKKVSKTGKITYKSVDKPSRKKWAIEQAINILAERNDFNTLSLLESSKKKDDIADCILQSLSAIYLIYVEKSI